MPVCNILNEAADHRMVAVDMCCLQVAMASFYEEDDEVGEDIAIPDAMRPSTPPTDINNQNSGVGNPPGRGADRGR